MQQEIEQFISSIADFAEVVRDRNDLLAHFGYFLSEIMKTPIRPSTLTQCYESAALPVPPRLDVVIPRSGKFVRTDNGYLLHREERQRISTKLLSRSRPQVEERRGAAAAPQKEDGKARKVFVVYGRDERLRNSLFQFLRALGLEPLEWNQLVKLTGKGSPYVGDVLKCGFENVQAIVVLLCPDEAATLRKDLHVSPEDSDSFAQPRPNVMVEAGMALGINEDRTILVQVGNVRRITDLEGRHTVHLDDSPAKRNALAQRLEDAGCDVQRIGDDWLKVGNFQVKAVMKRVRKI